MSLQALLTRQPLVTRLVSSWSYNGIQRVGLRSGISCFSSVAPPSSPELSAAEPPSASDAPAFVQPAHHTPKRTHVQFDGIVVSDKMQKTIMVEVSRIKVNKKYGKGRLASKKYMTHDEDEVCNIGDKVRIEFCRPLSRHKRYKFVMKLAEAKTA